jgi:hypothetical protein
MAIMPQIFLRRKSDDRISDFARAGRADCDRGMGGMRVSVGIVRFIARPRHDDAQTDFPTIAFRSAIPDIAADRAGTAAGGRGGRTTSAPASAPLNNEDRTFATE